MLEPRVFGGAMPVLHFGRDGDDGSWSHLYWLLAPFMIPTATCDADQHLHLLMMDMPIITAARLKGDIVFIDTSATPRNGDHVLLFLDDEALIKEYQYNPETRKLRLIPINRRYEVIEISKRSTRIRIVGVVVFSFHKLRKKKEIALGVVKGNVVAPPRKAKQTAPEPAAPAAEPVSQLDIPRLHRLIDGKKGKAVALAIYCAAKLGLITQTDYNAVTEEFGDIGSRQNYYRYLSNPQRFSAIEVETTKSFLTSKEFRQ